MQQARRRMAPSPASPRVAPVLLQPIPLLTLVLGGVQWALLAEAPSGLPLVAWLYAPTGMLFAVAAVVAMRRRPTNQLGALLALTGLVVIASELNVSGPPGTVAASLVIAVTPLGFAMHLLLAFPSGHLRSRADRRVVAAGYAITLLFPAPAYLLLPRGTTPLSIGDAPVVREVFRDLGGVTFTVAAVVAAVLLARRLGDYGERQRRALVPLYGYGTLALLSFPVAPNLIGRLLGAGPGVSETIQLVAVAGIPVAFVVTLVVGGWARSTGTEDLTLRLSQPGATTADELARALGDRSVRLLDRVPEELGPTRGVVPLDVDGRELGAIEYDARLLGDTDAVRAAAAIVATSLDRERLAFELRDASARMVEAADRERTRIARDLHDGLQAKLVLLALRAGISDGDDDGALRDELTGAVDDLRAFVQGIMPAGLIERGLEAALEDLADRMPVSTAVRIDLAAKPLPDAVESTAYFLVAEGLSNAVKHGHARAARVDVARRNGSLVVQVADDGVGGAVPGDGLGLRGLRDRVDALGGELTIASPAGGGTHLAARLPCAS